MNSTSQTGANHPRDNELKGFVRGQLTTMRQMQIEDHVLHCELCCDKLEELEDATSRSMDTLQSQLKKITDSNSQTVPSTYSNDSNPLKLIPPALANHAEFEVLEHIGSGGMGHVFRVMHRTSNKVFAVKVIKPQFLKDKNALRRFRLEIKAASRLRHQNIVAGIEIKQDEDLNILAMEFIEGKKISQIVRSGKLLPIRNACHYARQVALGLGHAFEQNLSHRDIKPSNLFLTKDQFVKIMDFGLAKFSRETKEDGEASLTQEGEAFGTPDYVAPEQIRDAKSADIRADIYSLGCTLYFMLTASKPFPEKTIGEKLVAHLQQEPTPVQQLRPDVSNELSSVLGKMMNKDPIQRYQTPAEVEQALRTFCEKNP